MHSRHVHSWLHSFHCACRAIAFVTRHSGHTSHARRIHVRRVRLRRHVRHVHVCGILCRGRHALHIHRAHLCLRCVSVRNGRVSAHLHPCHGSRLPFGCGLTGHRHRHCW